jgi:hypothetical protein
MRKNAQLSVRITDQEMTNLRQLADRECVLLSVLIRGLLAASTTQGFPRLPWRQEEPTPLLRPQSVQIVSEVLRGSGLGG